MLPSYNSGIDRLAIDRRLRDGEVVEWEGYRLQLDWMPGQTEFGCCLWLELDDLRVAFTGDNIFGDPSDAQQDGHEAVVARNSAVFEEGYLYAAEYLKRLKPDLLMGGHSFVMPKPAEFINRYHRWAQDIIRIYQDLLPGPDYRYRFDPYWVKAKPYRVRLEPGQSAKVQVVVRNFRTRDQSHHIRVGTPPGITAQPRVLDGVVASESRRSFPVRLTATADVQPGVNLAAFDITLDGQRYGQWFDFIVQITSPSVFPSHEAERGRVAPKPLYRDPIYDGAADPVLIWNRQREKWWMLYTNRRANVPGLRGVSWVHGTRIGIAESEDGGVTWKYQGTAQMDLGVEEDSHWAPDVLCHDGRYHMFLSFVPGMHEDWSGTRYIHHLISEDLVHWQDQGRLHLASDRVIDASVMQTANGTWRMWYNNERDRKAIYLAESPDLNRWTDRGKVIGDKAGEGPKVFRWRDHYWMIVDQWQGLGVYRSDDADTWQRQPDNLLAAPGQGRDDQVKGGHADVVVSGDRAYLFYFTHPGRRGADVGKDGYEQRRSSIQVVELGVVDGWLRCDRDKPTRIRLLPAHVQDGSTETRDRKPN